MEQEEILKLFDTAFHSLPPGALPNLEIELFSLQRAPKPERILVLFELAEEEFKDPSLSQRFTKFKEIASSQRIDTRAIQAQLRSIEKKIDAPFRLGKSKPTQPQPNVPPTQIPEVISEPTQANRIQRAGAEGTDLLFSLLLAACFAIFTRCLQSNEFQLQFFSFQPPSPIDLTALVVFAIAYLPLAIIIVCALVGALIGRTGGEGTFGLRLYRTQGHQASPSQRFFRGALIPFDLAVAGIFPILFGRRTLSEFLSGTVTKQS